MSFDVVAFLKDLGPFSDLSRNALLGVAKMVKVRDCADGERIIARGEPGDAMYIIRSGQVRIPILDASGNERMVAKLSEKQFFGEMSLMTGDLRTADVYATGSVSTLVIAKDVFQEMVRTIPSLARFLTTILADRLAEGGLMASKTIGKYQLLGELGRGGMSVVYNAVHTALNRPVAVKMLNHQYAFDEKFRASFHDEARLIAGLDHENLVRVYDTEEAYATYFIMMEYVTGTPISRMIAAAGLISPGEVRDILVQMCRALGYAHQRGIVHRDVKPSNAIMTPDGRVKLMDFGIAFRSDTAATAGEDIVGTAEYMAPEQVQGQPVDRRADVYALGVMAYQMLTDELPFMADNPYDILVAHVTKPMPSVRVKAPGAPDDLVEFVERATRKDPSERFGAMEEAEALLAPQTARTSWGAREGQVVSIFYPPSEAGSVERAIASLRQALAGNGNVRVGVSTLAAP